MNPWIVLRSRRLVLRTLAALALLPLSPVTAAPAKPGLFELKQPDGTTIKARARGDENFHWYEDEQGRAIERNPAGEWVYLAASRDPAAKKAVRTKRVAGKHQPPARLWVPKRPAGLKMRTPVRSVPVPADLPKTRDSGSTPKGSAHDLRKPPVSGNTQARLATLCVRYADRLDQAVFDTSVFEQSLFGVTATHTTMRDYFREISFGTFDLTGGPEGVSGWYNLPQSRAFYGANASEDNKDVNKLQLLYDVLEQANPHFNFGPYDTNNDGYVDCLGLILQGRGEEESDEADAVWPHQFSISELRGMPYSTGAWPTGDTNALGNPVYVDTYIAMPSEQMAREGGSIIPRPIGVFCHEYGHALGIPDLYDTDESSEGLGDWSLMAGGSWTGRKESGDCPTWMDAWSRAKLGFTSVENITYNHQNFVIKDAKEENKVYRLWREGALGTEYFLMENRQQSGFDQALPGAGLLIYHVDDAVTTGNTKEWYNGEGGHRTRSGHYRVALEQADGLYNLERRGTDPTGTPRGNSGDKGDPFVPDKDFAESGLTNSAAYNIPPASGSGTATYVAVRDIVQSGTSLTADVFVHVDKDFPTAVISSPAGDGTVLEHLSSFAGTASDAFGVSQVRVGLNETKPGGRWWDWISDSWGSSTFDDSRHLENASGTNSWSKSFNDAAFSDGGYRLVVTAIDTSGTPSGFVYREFRIQRDTTLPTIAIQSPLAGAAYPAVPAASGTATDNVAVEVVRLALFSKTLGLWLHWDVGDFDTAAYVFSRHAEPVTPAGNSWTLPLPADLTHGSYILYAQAVDTTDQGSDWVALEFTIERAPVVRILGPLADKVTNTFSEIHGIVQDTGGLGIPTNQVDLTINRNLEYWTGTSWTTTATAVTAAIAGDGSWSYSSLPTDDGLYSVTASVVDGGGVRPVQQPGENQIFFQLDMTPPEVTIASPGAGITITEAPLVAPFITGSARDNLGKPAVTLHLKRLENDTYWNGRDWIPDIDPAALSTAFPGDDGGSRVAWEYTGRLPRLGCMPNGNYEVIAVARDSAGNEGQTSSFFLVDYNPEWLRQEDAATTVLPPQTPPIAAEAITLSDLGEITNLRKPSGDDRRVIPSTLHFDASANPYVVSHSVEPLAVQGGPPGGITFHHGVLLRHGAGGWRREREAELATSPPAVLERWDTSGPYQTQSPWDAVREGPMTTAFDGDGNCFLAFTVLQQETAYWSDGITHSYPGWEPSPRVMVAKFNAAGTLVWRALLPPDSDTTGWLADSRVIEIKPMSDGGAAVLIENYYDIISPYFSFTRTPQTVVAVVNNGSVGYTRFFGHTESGEDEEFESTPEFLAVDPSNHVFVLSHELDEKVIRRLAPSGEVTATYSTRSCETPQSIRGMAADAAGNLHLASVFTVAAGDQRQCLTKLTPSLALAWRAFGPQGSADPEAGMILHVAPSHVTLVSHAAADVSHFYPYEHPVVSRFTTGGHLVWSRGFQSGLATAQDGDVLSHAEFDAAGSILFMAALGPTGSFHYGKLSAAGDLQFLRPVTQIFRDTALLPDGRMGLLVQDGTYPNEAPFRIVALSQPASVVLQPVFDPQPQDAIVNVGEPLVLTAVDRGSPATYRWQKMDGGGTYQDLPGEVEPVLSIETADASDAGTYRLVATNTAGTTNSRTVAVQVRGPVLLGDALEQPSLVWTTGGDAPWQGVAPGPSFDGIDAAESGSLEGPGTSWIRTTIEGPTTLRFRWKVSSVPGFNTLTLWVDGSQQNVISGEVDWTQGEVVLAAGPHTVEWRYDKAISFAEGSDRAWLDQVQTGGASAPALHPSYPQDAEVAPGTSATLVSINLGGPASYQWYKLNTQGVPVAISDATGPELTIGSFQASDAGGYMVLASNSGGTVGSRIAQLTLASTGPGLTEALDEPGRSWTTGGTTAARWTGQNHATAQDGADQAIAGPAADGSNTWLETTVTGPGSASFWWRTSSEEDYDFLTFTLDGASPQAISGATAWSQVTVSIPSGSHVLRWTYGKDDSVASGADRGYLDHFAFTPTGGSGGFSSWRATQGFSAAELLNAQISGPEADPDDDDLANLIEYVLGLSARTPNGTAGLIEPVRTSNQLSLRFTRVKGTSGVVVGAQAWNGNIASPWTSAGIVLVKVSETVTHETWEARLPTIASKSFLRLNVTESP